MRIISISIIFIFLVSCINPGNRPEKEQQSISGDIIIFHAGSLSVPFRNIAKAFELENPGVKVLLEAAGSVDCARKITDLHKPCDLMASSDYKVIENFLIPDYTSWHLPFAGNEMVIAFTGKSRKQDIISINNWHEILLESEVRFGRSDPDADPCGYRTLIVMQLAANYYGVNDLTDKLSSKDSKYIRPKEVDLLAMLELHETDYIFIYRSVAVQHGLKFITLPDEINLEKFEFDELYRQASVTIRGSVPESRINVEGETIAYAVTLLDRAPNPAAAQAFLEYMLQEDKGIRILMESGHTTLIPAPPSESFTYPEYLNKYIQH
jgi:molybdate/tungstate transport system substrate-binding protein